MREGVREGVREVVSDWVDENRIHYYLALYHLTKEVEQLV